MLISATGQKSNSTPRIRVYERGVTLVELLVVLAIIAMIASVVVLSAPPPVSNAQRESEKLAARIDYATGEAVTSGESLGLEISDGGYRFLKYSRGEWKALSSAQFVEQRFPDDLTVEVKLEDQAKRNEPRERKTGDEEKPQPEIRFAPTGETTPFSVIFRSQRQNAGVSLDGAGSVSVSMDDDDV